MTTTEIDGETIKQIRKARGQTQTEFGLDLYATTPGTAQKLVSRMEAGKQDPGKAALRTLRRMQAGEI